MSAEATGWTWKHSPFSGSQLLVHLAIADVVNDLHENEFWMSTETLARKAKVSRSTVTETLRCLVDYGGLLVLEPGGASRRPTRYQWQFASTTSALASPISDAASALTDSTSADSARNTKEPNEIPKVASAISGLVRREPPAVPPPWITAGMTRQAWLAGGG